MVRPTLALAVCIALLCVTLTYSAPIDEEAGSACETDVKNTAKKIKALVKDVGKVEDIPEKSEEEAVKCASKKKPAKIALCVKKILTGDEKTVKNESKNIEKAVQQLEKALENDAKKCAGGGGGGGGGGGKKGK